MPPASDRMPLRASPGPVRSTTRHLFHRQRRSSERAPPRTSGPTLEHQAGHLDSGKEAPFVRPAPASRCSERRFAPTVHDRRSRRSRWSETTVHDERNQQLDDHVDRIARRCAPPPSPRGRFPRTRGLRPARRRRRPRRPVPPAAVTRGRRCTFAARSSSSSGFAGARPLDSEISVPDCGAMARMARRVSSSPVGTVTRTDGEWASSNADESVVHG